MPKHTPICLPLPKTQLDALRKRKEASGISVVEQIRRAIAKALGEKEAA